MKDLIEEVFGQSKLDPNEIARETMRTPLRKRFYKAASIVDAQGGYGVELDGRGLRTPAKAPLVAPNAAIAQAIADEWNAQGEEIKPASMPLTRLANSIIDGVASRSKDVAAEIVKYAGSDLVFYRADTPEALVARQSATWNPVIAWADARFHGRFILAEGIHHVAQPQTALDAIAQALPENAWALGALHLATTLTGSALLALALASDKLDAAQAWHAAHVDEDWNFEIWGADEAVLARRAARFADFEAASLILRLFPLADRAG